MKFQYIIIFIIFFLSTTCGNMGHCVFNQQLIQYNFVLLYAAKVHREKRRLRQGNMKYNVIMLTRMV